MQDTGTISLYRSFLRGGGLGILAGGQGRDVWQGSRGRTSGREVGVGRLNSAWKDWEFGQAAKNGTSELDMEAGTMGGRGKELRICQDGSRLIQNGQRAYRANTCKSNT